MFFTGLLFGLTYFADIMPTTINGPTEYRLEVYTVAPDGRRFYEYTRLYRTEKSAEKALRRKYPEGGWRVL